MTTAEEKTLRDYSLLGAESKRAIEMGLVNAEWYQSPIPRDKMRELLVRKDGPAIFDTLLWFGLLIGSGILVYLWWGSWIAIFPYIVYSVIYASSSDSRWHEAGHGTAFKTDWMNNALYEISSFMVFRQSTVWRWSHARHHSDTIIRGSDPEISVPRPPSLTTLIITFFGISAAVPEMRKLLIHASGKIEPQVATYVPESEHGKVIFKARVYLAIFIAVIALCIVFRSILPLMYIGLPTLLGSWLMPLYGFTQHAGLDENVLDHRLNSRTVYMNRINRFLYWNMNYHVEHHMFPLVPYHALPKLHELMKDDCPKPYGSILEAFREIIPTILKQRKDPTYFVERKLPPNAGTQRALPKNKLLGDKTKIHNGIIEVCYTGTLPKGEVIRFDLDHKTYALYRTETGQLFATDGICTQGNSHLSKVFIIGNMIECPKHNGRFDLDTGAPKRDPVCVGITTYKAFEQGGAVYLDLKPLNEQNQPAEKRFRVVSNQNVATFIKELVLEPIGTDAFEYLAGQYIQLTIPPGSVSFSDFNIDERFRPDWNATDLFECTAENLLGIKRNYSLATNPAGDGPLKFNVRISLPPEGKKVSAGLGSSYVFNLKTGDEVSLSGPFGDFLIKPTEREMIYIGGGAGMAPLRSHISYLLETLKTDRKISYWYGARSKSELFYVDYFKELEQKHPNFSFHIALSEPVANDEHDGYTGFISDVLHREYLANHMGASEAEYYLCGPPMMISAALTMLEKAGIPKEQIAYDEF